MPARAISQIECAGFVSRTAAFVIDLVVLAAAFGAAAWIVRNVELLLRPTARLDLAPILGLAVPLMVVAYFVVLWAVVGQTVGKRVLGLRVVDATGAPIGLGRAGVRMLGYLVSALPAYLGFAWVLLDPKRRGWHDLLAGTLVVYDRAPARVGPDLEGSLVR